MIQTNLRAREVKESEADAEIAKQKKMVDLAAQEAEVQQRKLDAEVRKQAVPSFTAARRRPKRKSMRLSAPPRLQSSPSSRRPRALHWSAVPRRRLSARRVWLRPRR